jgi:hypothetical protein
LRSVMCILVGIRGCGSCSSGESVRGWWWIGVISGRGRVRGVVVVVVLAYVLGAEIRVLGILGVICKVAILSVGGGGGRDRAVGYLIVAISGRSLRLSLDRGQPSHLDVFYRLRFGPGIFNAACLSRIPCWHGRQGVFIDLFVRGIEGSSSWNSAVGHWVRRGLIARIGSRRHMLVVILVPGWLLSRSRTSTASTATA